MNKILVLAGSYKQFISRFNSTTYKYIDNIDQLRGLRLEDYEIIYHGTWYNKHNIDQILEFLK